MKVYIVIVILLFTTFSFSQNTLTGKVVNDKSEPIIGVHLHISKYDANSDLEGNFKFESLPNGEFTLQVSHLGYEKFQLKITLSNTDEFKIITLKPKVNFMEEVHIEGVSHNTRNVVNGNKIRSNQIEKVTDGAFSEVLKEVAGVSILKSGNVLKPMINGLHSSRVTILNNNVRLEDQQWGIDHAPNLDLSAVGKITIVKGSNALQFSGDAVGGIVIVEPMEIKRDTLLGKSIVSFNTNGRGGGLSTSIFNAKQKGLSFDFTTSMKYFGDKTSPDYVLSNSAMKDFAISNNFYYTKGNYKWNAFLSYYKTQLGIIRAAHTGSSVDLYNSISNQIPSYIAPFSYNINNPKQEVSHSIAKVSLDIKNWKFQYAYQYNDRQEFDLRRQNYSEKPALSLGLSSHSSSIDWQNNDKAFKIKSGLSFGYQNNVARPETGIRPLIPNFKKLDLGIYGVINKQINQKLSAELGLRFDFTNIEASKFYLKSRWLQLNYDDLFPQFFVKEEEGQILMKPQFNYFNISSSLGINYHFSEHWNWLPAVSLIMRNPNPAELFSDGLHHATGMIELGSLTLEKEKGIKIYSPIKFSKSNVEIEINPYYNVFTNFIYEEPKGVENTIRGDFLVWDYKQARATIYGCDLSLFYQINSHFSYKLKSSWLNGYNHTDKEPLIDMAPFNLSNELSYKSNFLYEAQFALKGEYIAQQTNFPNNNFVINVVKNNDLVPELVDVSTPPNSYYLFHFESQFEPKIFTKINTTVNFNISNIFNTSYRDYLNRQRFFADDLGRNFKIQLKFNY